MRKSILGLFMLLCAAVSMYAQKFELSGAVGFQHHTRIRAKGADGFLGASSARQSSPVLSLGTAYNIDKWQLGVTASYTSFDFSYPSYMPQPNVRYFAAPKEMFGHFDAVPVTLCVNRKMPFKKFELYGGAKAGAVFSVNKKMLTSGDGVTNTVSDDGIATGYTAGVQFGGNYNFGRRMGINAEVGCNCTNFRQNFDPTYTFSIPAVLGFKYRFKPDTNKHR